MKHEYGLFVGTGKWSHWIACMCNWHYSDVIMGMIASQITNLTIVYSTIYQDADQRKHQSSASLAFARGIHRVPVNSPHKGPVMWKIFPFDDVIMEWVIVASENSLLLNNAKLWPQPLLSYCQLNPWEQNSVKFQYIYQSLHWRKYIWKCCLHIVSHLFPTWMCYPMFPPKGNAAQKHEKYISHVDLTFISQ